MQKPLVECERSDSDKFIRGELSSAQGPREFPEVSKLCYKTSLLKFLLEEVSNGEEYACSFFW